MAFSRNSACCFHHEQRRDLSEMTRSNKKTLMFLCNSNASARAQANKTCKQYSKEDLSKVMAHRVVLHLGVSSLLDTEVQGQNQP